MNEFRLIFFIKIYSSISIFFSLKQNILTCPAYSASSLYLLIYFISIILAFLACNLRKKWHKSKFKLSEPLSNNYQYLNHVNVRNWWPRQIQIHLQDILVENNFFILKKKSDLLFCIILDFLNKFLLFIILYTIFWFSKWFH
jgi:hypothetical protein